MVTVIPIVLLENVFKYGMDSVKITISHNNDKYFLPIRFLKYIKTFFIVYSTGIVNTSGKVKPSTYGK